MGKCGLAGNSLCSPISSRSAQDTLPCLASEVASFSISFCSSGDAFVVLVFRCRRLSVDSLAALIDALPVPARLGEAVPSTLGGRSDVARTMVTGCAGEALSTLLSVSHVSEKLHPSVGTASEGLGGSTPDAAAATLPSALSSAVADNVGLQAAVAAEARSETLSWMPLQCSDGACEPLCGAVMAVEGCVDSQLVRTAMACLV
eukprot:CAMPEP_0206143110 /NCGR_PEP_ID=MMETSP1473-20131121/19323_1 /ASSEMBLY_ACC=CAM_ASM_001109 /TAXON_ID=1461547 /ORGANISM="Stichococcus sp, Strain RCC1054" /LENGTH=202 /DNA_ID=CAMNT_0053538373 /DNA_START=2795 /DNA_END=3404 /DNA_ORIENTATION=-